MDDAGLSVIHAIGLITNLIVAANGQLSQVIITSIIDIEVYIPLDARQATTVGMLPEFPLTLVFHLVNIIMCYLIWILVEYGVADILCLEFIISIDYWFHTIFLFHSLQPCEHATLEIII